MTMNLEKLKKEIEDKGYKAVLRKNEISWLQCYIPFEIEEHNKFISFVVSINEQNEIIFRDGNEQIPKPKVFQKEEELFDYLEDFKVN